MNGTVTISDNMNIILNDVIINQTNNSLSGAFIIDDGYTVTIYLADGSENDITGSNGFGNDADTLLGAGKAGISVHENSSLIIDSIVLDEGVYSFVNVQGTGKLTAKGGIGSHDLGGDIFSGSGAGIGGRGGYPENEYTKEGAPVGNISIFNGDITAIGGDSTVSHIESGSIKDSVGPGRDIGGGSGGRKNSKSDGGGYGGSVNSITISGGIINATKYGIGGGHGGDKTTGAGGGNGGSGDINISGGIITIGSEYGNLIGGGDGGDSSNGKFGETQGTGGGGSINIGGNAVLFIPADVDPSNLTGVISAGCNGDDGDTQGTVTVIVDGTINTNNIISGDCAVFNANGGMFTDDNLFWSFNLDSSPSLSDATSQMPSVAKPGYTLSGWAESASDSSILPNDTGLSKVVYYAVWTPALSEYTVTWKNDNGVVLKTDIVAYGAFPTYSGETPVKSSDAEFNYVFRGWSPSIDAVAGDVIYTAQYDEIRRSYEVTWQNFDLTELKVDTVLYGTTPVYNGETPVKDSDAEFNYVFRGWSPSIDAVAGDVIYTAQYDEIRRSYEVTWQNFDLT
ncbi:hypothetical protein KJR02_08185, partial [Methanimicrococcus blatticola]|nr:hypothetical protein [Methanimicrococcus blatticola]